MRSAYLLFFFLLPGLMFAQTANKIVYGELLGGADVYSINGEFLFKPKHSVRLGFSWFPGNWKYQGTDERTYVYLPLTYQFLTGKGNNKLEAAGGLLSTWTIYSRQPNHIKLTPQLALAYRYQRSSGGLFLRAGCHLFMPVFLSIDRYETFSYTGKHWYFWPGMAVGWSF
jgi:hypothetical protein